MKQKLYYIQSDIFYQVKSSDFLKIKKLIDMGAKHSPYLFNNSKCSPQGDKIFAISKLQLTNIEVFNLLNKAINIVKDTEEYINYALTTTFSDSKSNYYSIPPGTIRFYDFDLICFYNGKTWRKIER